MVLAEKKLVNDVLIITRIKFIQQNGTPFRKSKNTLIFPEASADLHQMVTEN
jgi:hypothetical protein